MKKKPKGRPDSKVAARFVKGVIADVKERFHRRRSPVHWIDHFAFLDDPNNMHSYSLLAMHQDQKVYWILRSSELPSERNIIGAGFFTFRRRPTKVLQEQMAAIIHEHRGLGLYPKVLRSLRFSFKRPLESDVELSQANVRAWSKVGVWRPDLGRFRINPALRELPPLAQDIQMSWLMTEGYIPKKYQAPKGYRNIV